MARNSRAKANPRKHKDSDDVWNLRRRLMRRAKTQRKNGNLAEAARLEELAQKTQAVKKPGETRARLDNVRDAIEAARQAINSLVRREKREKSRRMQDRGAGETRAEELGKIQERRMPPKDEQRELVRRARNVDEPEGPTERVTPDQLGEPSEGKRGELTKEERAALYGATRNDWLGIPRKYRQSYLLNEYKVETEEELFSMLEARIEKYLKRTDVHTMNLETKYQSLVQVAGKR